VSAPFRESRKTVPNLRAAFEVFRISFRRGTASGAYEKRRGHVELYDRSGLCLPGLF